MADIVADAREARENLARGLSLLQDNDNTPSEYLEAAEPIACAMGALHSIERGGSAAINPAAAEALQSVRSALAVLQARSDVDPQMLATMEVVASSLGTVFGLAKIAETYAEESRPTISENIDHTDANYRDVEPIVPPQRVPALRQQAYQRQPEQHHARPVYHGPPRPAQPDPAGVGRPAQRAVPPALVRRQPPAPAQLPPEMSDRQRIRRPPQPAYVQQKERPRGVEPQRSHKPVERPYQPAYLYQRGNQEVEPVPLATIPSPEPARGSDPPLEMKPAAARAQPLRPQQPPPRRPQPQQPEQMPPRRPQPQQPEQMPPRRPQPQQPEQMPPRRLQPQQPEQMPPRRPQPQQPPPQQRVVRPSRLPSQQSFQRDQSRDDQQFPQQSPRQPSRLKQEPQQSPDSVEESASRVVFQGPVLHPIFNTNQLPQSPAESDSFRVEQALPVFDAPVPAKASPQSPARSAFDLSGVAPRESGHLLQGLAKSKESVPVDEPDFAPFVTAESVDRGETGTWNESDPFASQRPISPPDGKHSDKQSEIDRADLPILTAELASNSASNFYQGFGGSDVIVHGGLFVATHRSHSVGDRVKVLITMPGGFEFRVVGIVRWTREFQSSLPDVTQPGCGVQITDICAENRKLVYRYVRNREPLFYDES